MKRLPTPSASLEIVERLDKTLEKAGGVHSVSRVSPVCLEDRADPASAFS